MAYVLHEPDGEGFQGMKAKRNFDEPWMAWRNYLNRTHSDEASNNGEEWFDLPRLPFISNPFRSSFFYPIVLRLTIADQRPRFRISIHRTLLEDGAPVDSSDPSFVQLLGTSWKKNHKHISWMLEKTKSINYKTTWIYQFVTQYKK